MKKRKLGSYIILSILFLLTIAFVLDYLGIFDSIRIEYEEKSIAEELKNIQPSKPLNDKVAKALPLPESTDTKTSASIAPSPSTTPPQTEEIRNEVNLLASQSIVSIVQSYKTNAYEISSEEIEEMVRKAVELAGGFKDLIKDGQVVVLKPNLVQIHSDVTGKRFDKEANGITTDWRITKAVVKVLREYNPSGKIYVMEGSAGDRTKVSFDYMNYTHEFIPGVDQFIALEDSSGGWQEFNSQKLVRVDLPNGLLHKEYYLNKLYKEADVLISLPCLKNNSGTVVTGGIKNVGIGATPANIYGLSEKSTSRTKMVSHSFNKSDLHRWIHDYYICRPVDFVIMDGLQGFQNGPAPYKKDSEKTDIMNMRLIIAGKDAVAVDTIEALVTGWDPLSTKYLRYLNASSMGNIDTSKITVLGKKVDEVRRFFHTKIKNSGGIEVEDLQPPSIDIAQISSKDNLLDIKLNTEKDTTKVELFIDNVLAGLFYPTENKDISLDIRKLNKGAHELKAVSYDRFLNSSNEQTEFIK